MKIELDADQKMHLTILLNVELRNRHFTPKYAGIMNGIYKQLVGHDHESMESRESI